jgi:hypothetical protein
MKINNILKSSSTRFKRERVKSQDAEKGFCSLSFKYLTEED